MSETMTPRQALITYYYHCGLSVAVDDTLLVFDYWRGPEDKPVIDKQTLADDLEPYSSVVFFVSHAHTDHCDDVIYEFAQRPGVHYIASSDLPIGKRGKRLAPGDEADVAGAHIRAFDSTDIGVSYWVDIGGVSVFHAGDLNLWHWRDEFSVRQIVEAEKLFDLALKPLIGLQPDIAMFPVDPRMGSFYEAGATSFILSVKPRVFIPMHFWDRPEAAREFERNEKALYTHIVAMTEPVTRARVTFARGKRPAVQVTGASEAHMKKSSTEVAGERNPFIDTDLPVEL